MKNNLLLSESNEHYTPAPVFDVLSRRLWRDGVELDLFSCDLANKIVRAKTFLAASHDTFNIKLPLGISTAFANPPGGKLLKRDGRWVAHSSGRSSQALAWECLLNAWEDGLIHEAVFLAFNLNAAIPLCPTMTQFPMVFTARGAMNPAVSCGGRLRFWASRDAAIQKAEEDLRDGRITQKDLQRRLVAIERRTLSDYPEFFVESTPTHPNLFVYLPPRNRNLWASKSRIFCEDMGREFGTAVDRPYLEAA